uniref:Uncharacterized protein n=1 Tax=Avena sativa TaxID=4498 RepID=A0ACD5W248_AVESA
MDAPNTFSSQLEKWIYNRSKGSIFFVNVVPKDLDEIEQRMKNFGYIEEDKRDKELDKEGTCCTGFVVEEKGMHLKILTCAHLMQHVFKGSDVISVQKANDLFSVYVLCDHFEENFRSPEQRTHGVRTYARATMIGINCRKDLLLLQVVRKDVMDLGRPCGNSHRALTISPTPPETLDKCAMVSWPPHQPRTAVSGEISHPSRSFEDTEEKNPIGYTMNFTQANIASEDGSSGAPLLDGNGRIIGLLHGGFGGRFSYFVSHFDIRRFLRQYGVQHGN